MNQEFTWILKICILKNHRRPVANRVKLMLEMSAVCLSSVLPSVRLSVPSCVRQSVRLSTCLPVRPSICPYLRLPACPSVHLSVSPPVCLSVRPPVCPSVSPSIRPAPAVRLCVSRFVALTNDPTLSVCLSICLFVCLSSRYLSIYQYNLQ